MNSIICAQCNQSLYTDQTIYRGYDHTFCSVSCRKTKILKLNETPHLLPSFLRTPTSKASDYTIKKNASHSSITISQQITEPITNHEINDTPTDNLDKNVSTKTKSIGAICISLCNAIYLITCLFGIYNLRVYNINLYTLNSDR